MLVAKGADPDALVEFFFARNGDADAASYDRQPEAYAADARDLARTLMLSGAEAAVARIVEELRSIRRSLRTLAAGVWRDRSGSTCSAEEGGWAKLFRPFLLSGVAKGGRQQERYG